MCVLLEDALPVFSAIFLPTQYLLTHEVGIYVAGRGHGAWRMIPLEASSKISLKKRIPLCVSLTSQLSRAFLLFEGPTKKILGSPLADKAKWASRRHRYGTSSSWSGVLVASGGLYPSGFDGLIICDNKLWDNLPIALLIEEAGGRVTDFAGNPYSATNCGSLICSNGLLHNEMVKFGKET
jgi:fructose-1,6-bisphosphatase/inositol monophosphatase family enzyme